MVIMLEMPPRLKRVPSMSLVNSPVKPVAMEFRIGADAELGLGDEGRDDAGDGAGQQGQEGGNLLDGQQDGQDRDQEQESGDTLKVAVMLCRDSGHISQIGAGSRCAGSPGQSRGRRRSAWREPWCTAWT